MRLEAGADVSFVFTGDQTFPGLPSKSWLHLALGGPASNIANRMNVRTATPMQRMAGSVSRKGGVKGQGDRQVLFSLEG